MTERGGGQRHGTERQRQRKARGQRGEGAGDGERGVKGGLPM